MKKHILTIILSLMALAIFADPPVVYGPYWPGNLVQAIPGIGKVDITYHFTAEVPCTISLEVSGNGPSGPFTWMSTTATTGDIGPNISPGMGKVITWHPGQESYELPIGTNYVVRVCADDGQP